MVVKPDWDIFKSNSAENPQSNFEWMWSLAARGEGIEWRYFTNRKRNRTLASRSFELKGGEAYPYRSAGTDRS